MSNAETRSFITRKYDWFEKEGLTVRQARGYVEAQLMTNRDVLAKLKTTLQDFEQFGQMLRQLRNDMSANVGNANEPFNRKRHTHGFKELKPD